MVIALARELAAFLWVIGRAMAPATAEKKNKNQKQRRCLKKKIKKILRPHRGATTVRRTLVSPKGIGRRPKLPSNRERQLRDEARSGGNPPAYIRVIKRRESVPPRWGLRIIPQLNKKTKGLSRLLDNFQPYQETGLDSERIPGTLPT